MAMETHSRVVYEGEPTRQEERREEIRHEESPRTYERAGSRGNMVVPFAGVGALVLAILGLVNIVPLYMAGISAIVVGAALLMQGGVMESWASRERFAEAIEGGFSAEMAGGIAGIVLGILALVGTATETLLPIAALVLGGSLFLGSWTGTVTGAKLFIGLGSIVLGILGLVGYVPLTLSLIAFLCLGCATFLHGSFLSGKLFSAARP